MSSRLTQGLLGLSLLLNCFVLAGFVYRSWIAPPPFGHAGPPPPGPSRGGPLEMLSQDLKLDEGQRRSLKQLFDRYAQERHERFREILTVREAMSEELKKPEFDTSRINELVDQMSKLRAEQQKENLSSIAQLAGELTPEQRQRLHTILAERYGPPQRQQAPHGPPPPEGERPPPAQPPGRP